MSEKTERKKWLGLDVSYIPLIIGALVTTGVIYTIYQTTQDVLRERLRERITSIVSTGVLQIDGDAVEQIIKQEEILSEALFPLLERATESFTYESYMQQINQVNLLGNHAAISVTEIMKRIRESNDDLTYIYILRPTADKNITKFVTDADTFIPVDWDENGKIDEIEFPPLPGEDYDVSEVDVLDKIFIESIAAESLYTDKWGTFLSGYSPIRNKNNEVIAALAIDVEVSDFNTLIRSLVTPFVLLTIVLLTMLTVQTVALVRIWRSRVDFLQELDRQKDELLSIVSHQLATPVSSVKWYIEMMLDGDMGKLSDAQEDQIETIQSVVNDLSDLVSMILDVSRFQLGRMKVNKSEFDLQKFLNDILIVIEPKAHEKNIHFEKELPSKLPSVTLDKRLVRITLENLLSNAIKYTPDNGNVTLKLAIDNNLLRFSVKDSGCGIPKKDQDKIFGKLYRASNVTNVDGNGFGLFAAKGATEAQGGNIAFESTEAKGTMFHVEIPLNQESDLDSGEKNE